MTETRRVVVAWSLFATAMLVTAIATVLWIVNAQHVPGTFAPQLLIVPTYGAVGAVVVARKGHVVGWLLLIFAVVAAVTAFSFEYSVAAYGDFVPSFPKISLLAWLQVELWPFNFIFLGLLLLLFPDGQTVSPRFHKVLIFMLVSWGLSDLGGGISPTPLELLVGRYALSVQNPFSVRIPLSVFDPVMTTIFIAALASVLVASVSPILKWRRGSSIIRDQIRWPALVVGISLVSLFVAVALVEWHVVAAESPILDIPLLGATVGLPVSIGVSILRYKLYEIERVVNRAIVYGAVTAILAATYVLAVFALRGILDPITGSSDLAVAGSTLAVAALFRPLRSRLQNFIDRRFNRRRFDVQQTLEGFSARLRDEVDLSALSAGLTEVVSETMQPAHVSLWLRPGGAG
jgi:hypothetical protein